MDLLRMLYGVVGSNFPIASLIIVTLLGAFIFGSLWWVLGRDYINHQPSIIEQTNTLPPPVSPSTEGSKTPDERRPVDVTPEFLMGLYKDRTTIQGNKLAEVYKGKWIKVSGPFGNVRELQNTGEREYTKSTYTMQVTFADPTDLVFMRFDKQWRERLEVIPQHKNISVLGQIISIDKGFLDLWNCELVDSEKASSQQSSSSTVQQQTIQNSPASTNIQARDIIINPPMPPTDASTAREKLGRLNIPYSVAGFIVSAQQGDTTAVKLFIESGMNVETKEDNNGRTALMEAAQAGHLGTVEALTRKKAGVNALDKLGDTALILAASRGHLEVVRTLLKKHAEPNTQNTTGRTALREAAENGHKLVVLALLDNGAQLEIRDKGEQKTPLLAAAMLHQTDIVKLLLDRGADANARDKYGHSSLIPAARAGHLDMVKALLSHGADVNAADKDGRTALMGAAVHGHSEVLTLLLEYRADVKLMDKEGKTALMWAESRGHNVIIELLRKAADAHGM